MNRLYSLYHALSTSSRRVFWVVIAIGVALLGFSITLIDSLLTSPGLFDLIATSTPFVLSFVAIISAISILYNRVQFGAWLFFVSATITMLIIPFIQAGYAFPAAVLVLVVTILIPLQVVRGTSVTFVTIGGFAVAAAIIAVDTYWTGERAEIGLENLQNARIATAALAIILVAAIFTFYSSFQLQTKLLLLTLGASLISVIAGASAADFYIEKALIQNTRANLLESAKYTADTIDLYIDFNAELLKTEANLPVFSHYLSFANISRAGLSDVQRTMQNLASRDTQNIRSYALLDKNGSIVWETRTSGPAFSPGQDQAQQDYFRIPYENGRLYIGPIRFIPGGTDNVFYMSAPIWDKKGTAVLGVLRVEIRASLLNDILIEANNAAGDGSFAILLDEYNLVLADPTNPESVSRAVSNLKQEQIDFLVEQNRISADIPTSQISLNMPQFAAGVDNINTSPFFESRDMAFGGAVYGAGQYLSSQPWKIVFLQPEIIALTPVQEQTRAIKSTALVVIFVLGIAAFFISRTIAKPIARLTQTAEEISAGNLEVRADIRSQDEIGMLASTINAMSDQLEQTLAGLETTISERTADLEQRSQELSQRSAELEAANRRAEHRAAQLLAVSTVSNAIASIQNLDELLPRITRTISEQFGFYHVGIFLNDASNQFAILRAANSEGGQRMLQRGHRLKIGEAGIVGNVVATGRPRIALDIGTDAVFLNNPDLPNTRSEMALPLRIGPIVIGALDVQSTESNAFTEEDTDILNTLASQVSIAIRNAQLFDETQRSTTELQTLLQKDASEQWRRVLQSQHRPGYYYDGVSLRPLERSTVKESDAMLIPIKVRGQVIGNLGIRPPAGRPLTAHEIDIIRAVSERLAISAENIRLFEDSQTRAVKEKIIGEISAKISTSINLENILQTAVEELGQVLNDSQISIRLKDRI